MVSRSDESDWMSNLEIKMSHSLPARAGRGELEVGPGDQQWRALLSTLR